MQRKNVVFFTWHDAGTLFGAYGCPNARTPAVDRLAAEGVLFANNFSASAICSPSRAAMMTGRYCQINGVMTLTNNPFMNRIAPQCVHLAKHLKQHGYHTALFGVQHEAAHEHVPEVMNFDEEYATDPWPNALQTAHYLREWFASRRPDLEQPFYLQIGTYEAHLNRFYSGSNASTNEPYPPVQDRAQPIERPPYLLDSDYTRETLATLSGLLARGDRLMQTLLEELDRHGLSEDTLVVMCVDHGPGLPRAKGTCYDAGTHTAWLMRCPGVIPAGTRVEALTTHVDVCPTICDLLDIPAPAPLDGLSFAGHARGKTAAELHDCVFSHMVENTRSLRTRRWRLIRHFRPPRYTGEPVDCAIFRQHPHTLASDRLDDDSGATSGLPHLELYDVTQDPWQLHNLAGSAEYATILRDLDDRLWEFLVETGDFIVHEPVRTSWQRTTREAFADYCRRRNIHWPRREGPLVNTIDRATKHGCVVSLKDALCRDSQELRDVSRHS